MQTSARAAVRVAAVVVPLVVVVSASAPALADTPNTWQVAPTHSMLRTLLFFGGIPIGLAVAIGLLVSIPSLVKGPRYRPGLSWWAEPEWFGGPAVEGAHQSALERSSSADAAADQVRTGDSLTAVKGGASARW
ncbi:MAG: aa3-type cytochrome oxidase subunit CtaJ [Nocardioidaceae bacterium]